MEIDPLTELEAPHNFAHTEHFVTEPKALEDPSFFSISPATSPLPSATLKTSFDHLLEGSQEENIPPKHSKPSSADAPTPKKSMVTQTAKASKANNPSVLKQGTASLMKQPSAKSGLKGPQVNAKAVTEKHAAATAPQSGMKQPSDLRRQNSSSKNVKGGTKSKRGTSAPQSKLKAPSVTSPPAVTPPAKKKEQEPEPGAKAEEKRNEGELVAPQTVIESPSPEPSQQTSNTSACSVPTVSTPSQDGSFVTPKSGLKQPEVKRTSSSKPLNRVAVTNAAQQHNTSSPDSGNSEPIKEAVSPIPSNASGHESDDTPCKKARMIENTLHSLKANIASVLAGDESSLSYSDYLSSYQSNASIINSYQSISDVMDSSKDTSFSRQTISEYLQWMLLQLTVGVRGERLDDGSLQANFPPELLEVGNQIVKEVLAGEQHQMQDKTQSLEKALEDNTAELVSMRKELQSLHAVIEEKTQRIKQLEDKLAASEVPTATLSSPSEATQPTTPRSLIRTVAEEATDAPKAERQAAAAARVVWQKDSDAADCNSCSQSFGVFRRRHHCRSCGFVFCDECTTGRALLAEYGCTSPVRVCGQCEKKIASSDAK